MYVRGRVLLSIEIHMIQGNKPSCSSVTRQGVNYITLEHPLVMVWMQALLDAVINSPLCGHQLRL